MSSRYVQNDNLTRTYNVRGSYDDPDGTFQVDVEQYDYLQFVQGRCTEVFTETNHRSAMGVGSDMIGAIKAEVVGDATVSGPGHGEVYKPLLRGMVDMPIMGDSVLLCRFGGQNFYLGPLNTEGHVNSGMDASFQGHVD